MVFYDALGLREGDGADLDALVQRRTAVVIVLTNELRPELGAAALERGATAAISMAATRADFLVVLQAALCGDLARCGPARAAQVGTQRGCEVGLTWREAEVIAGIVAGLSNREIATKSGLSINTVKSVVRSAYRKMEVETRSQAVKWGVQHGFAFDTAHARSGAEPLRRLPRGPGRTRIFASRSDSIRDTCDWVTPISCPTSACVRPWTKRSRTSSRSRQLIETRSGCSMVRTSAAARSGSSVPSVSRRRLVPSPRSALRDGA